MDVLEADAKKVRPIFKYSSILTFKPSIILSLRRAALVGPLSEVDLLVAASIHPPAELEFLNL